VSWTSSITLYSDPGAGPTVMGSSSPSHRTHSPPPYRDRVGQPELSRLTEHDVAGPGELAS
jgi:hypothetical protein